MQIRQTEEGIKVNVLVRPHFMEAIIAVGHDLALAVFQDKVIHETTIRHRHLGLPEIKDGSLRHTSHLGLFLISQEGILKDHLHLA